MSERFPRREIKSFLTGLCLVKNSLSRAVRGLAPTKCGVSRAAACDKREYLDGKPSFPSKRKCTLSLSAKGALQTHGSTLGFHSFSSVTGTHGAAFPPPGSGVVVQIAFVGQLAAVGFPL